MTLVWHRMSAATTASAGQRIAAANLVAGWLVFGSLLTAANSAETAPNFSRDILPILSDNCFHCHGPDAKQRQGDLQLDTEASALRTEEPVIVPGKSAESELMRRLISTDPDEQMPPPKSNRKLTKPQIELLKQWIDSGAKWGRHWAYEAPQRPALPSVKDAIWSKNPIDTFLLARLERENLKPSPEAPRETLIRRVTLDLTGLPPTLEEVAAFLKDDSPQAYETVVDRLLQSRRYGERMVWDWLDAARYADTNGYQGDPTRAMWYWRDQVIVALNRNQPFDQFTIEQLAGDLLPNPTQQQLIASGFHRNHMINGEGGRIAEESRVDYVQDRVETTGAVWMGLTFNCCRCHDHKFDPLKQREYYQLSAYFNSIEETGGNDAGGLANPVLSFASPEQQAELEKLRVVEKEAKAARDEYEKKLTELQKEWEQSRVIDQKELPADVRAIVEKTTETRSDAEKKKLSDHFRANHAPWTAAEKLAEDKRKARDQFEKSLPRTMVMRERAQPRETFILIRGAYDKPEAKVTHGVPAILPPLPKDAPTNRLALAQWLVASEHPLTSRVTVNRYWQSFFGTGLVKTTEDFGVQSERPSHPELLDWLACEFQQPTVSQPTVAHEGASNRWNVKHMHRLIVTSAAYRQSSKSSAELNDRDPANRLLARAPRQRWPSWLIRDQALAVSGLLVDKAGGPPVKGYQPTGVWEEATFGNIKYTQESGEALYRRSLYQFWRRIVGPTVFFDVANRQTCSVKSSRTNTPLHALTTLNDVTYVEASRAWAERLLKSEATSPEARLQLAYQQLLARQPSDNELQILLTAMKQLREKYAADAEGAKKLLSIGASKRDEKLDLIEHATYTAVCNLLLNLDEALTKE